MKLLLLFNDEEEPLIMDIELKGLVKVVEGNTSKVLQPEPTERQKRLL